ncbi:cyclase family protein [Sphingobium scionense]
MTRFIDLSHAIEHGMTTYKGVAAPHICDYWTREQSRANYADGSAFQMGRIDMVSNTGTYLDAPFHRFEEGDDLSMLDLGTGWPACRRSWCGGRSARWAWRRTPPISTASTSTAARCWSTPAGTGTGARRPIMRIIPS